MLLKPPRGVCCRPIVMADAVATAVSLHVDRWTVQLCVAVAPLTQLQLCNKQPLAAQSCMPWAASMQCCAIVRLALKACWQHHLISGMLCRAGCRYVSPGKFPAPACSFLLCCEARDSCCHTLLIYLQPCLTMAVSGTTKRAHMQHAKSDPPPRCLMYAVQRRPTPGWPGSASSHLQCVWRLPYFS